MIHWQQRYVPKSTKAAVPLALVYPASGDLRSPINVRLDNQIQSVQNIFQLDDDGSVLILVVHKNVS